MSRPPVSVITSDEHRSHNPEFDIYEGSLVGRFEVPQRVDRIVQALTGDAFAMVAPTQHGMEPILRVHNPDLVELPLHRVEGLHRDRLPFAGSRG